MLLEKRPFLKIGLVPPGLNLTENRALLCTHSSIMDVWIIFKAGLLLHVIIIII